MKTRRQPQNLTAETQRPRTQENPFQLGRDSLLRFAQRPKGPPVNRPGREAGIRLGKNNERRRCGTVGVPVLRPSIRRLWQSPPSRAGLFTAGPSALAKPARQDVEGIDADR